MSRSSISPEIVAAALSAVGDATSAATRCPAGATEHPALAMSASAPNPYVRALIRIL
jgi:hypothetical protein